MIPKLTGASRIASGLAFFLFIIISVACVQPPKLPDKAGTLTHSKDADQMSANLPTTPSISPEGPPSPAAEHWRLVWNDEFDGPPGSKPNAQKWTYNLGGGGWGNQEWEYYTDRPENVALDGNGSLVITALQIADPAASGLNCWYGPCRYTSGRILTQDRFEVTYGRVEARLRLPYGQGLWPAFWMLGIDIPTNGWPQCGEIDIMENIGKEPGIIHGSVHGPGYSGAEGISFPYSLNAEKQAFKDDFYIFAIEWEPAGLRWYVDGNLYATLKKEQFSESKPWVFDHPYFILLNVAVGGGWPGYPDETTVFPQTMLIDYVRVYQRDSDTP